MSNREPARAPIGMLDSGLGGLTVLKTAVRLLPFEDFNYLADFKHSPFGGRSKTELLGLLDDAVEKLLAQGIKALVLASNTATSAAAEVLRARLPIPVLGLEPALKPAVLAVPEGVILVLATELTLREEKFNRLYESFRARGGIVLKSCPGLVELIDSGQAGTPAIDAYLRSLFADLEPSAVRAVVLGCTHYVFVREAIMRHFGPEVLCWDGNEGVVRQLTRVLEENNLLAGAGRGGEIRFFSSDPGKLQFLEKQYGLLF
ncbi:MAG: glutamate racemase [Candidatus Firestonebacteria bacterium]|nr:glutamate racemase [Candidatus Firestonebacteria bacterium]